MKKHTVCAAVLGLFLATTLSLVPCYAKKPNLRRMKRTEKLFREKHIRTIQIVYLDVRRSRSYCLGTAVLANRTARDGQKLFDDKLNSILATTLLKKGYQVKYAQTQIAVHFYQDAGPLYKVEEVLPSVPLENDGDAVLFFLIENLIYPARSSAGWTNPYMGCYDADPGEELTEISGLSSVELWCDVFDLKSRTKVFSGHSEVYRKMKRHRTGQQGGLYTGLTVFFNWWFIESEEDLIGRAMSETLSEFPEAEVTK